MSALALNDYRSFLRLVRETIAEESRAVESKRLLKRKHDVILSVSNNTSSNRDVLRGDLEIRMLIKTLDEMGYERTLTQKQFHKNFISASLHSIYGEDFFRYQSRILAEHDLEEARNEVLVCTPRRFGKTTSVSLFIAAMLWSVSEAWISVFSTGQRASSMLLDLTFKMIMKLPNAKSRIMKRNQEELFIRDPDPSKPPRRLFSYPATVGGLKGVGAKIVILEEASRLDEAMFTEVIVPLLGVEGTAVIAISTPLEEDNFFTQMTRMKDPISGKPMFQSLTIQLCCDECRAKGVIDVCPHKKSYVPPWKADEGRNAKVKALMSNNSDMYQREALGISMSTQDMCFEPATIDTFSAAKINMVPFIGTIRNAFIAVDNNGGGANCMAIICIVMTPAKHLVIVSADNVQITSDAQLEHELGSHLDKLRNLPYLYNAEFICSLEANYGGWVCASRTAAIMARNPPIKFMTSDQSGARRPGVWTTAEIKERARIELSRHLREGTIKFASDFYTSRVGTENEIVSQMRRMRYHNKVPRDAHGTVRRALSGKQFGGGANGNDDLVVALFINVFWKMMYEDNRNLAVQIR